MDPEAKFAAQSCKDSTGNNSNCRSYTSKSVLRKSKRPNTKEEGVTGWVKREREGRETLFVVSEGVHFVSSVVPRRVFNLGQHRDTRSFEKKTTVRRKRAASRLGEHALIFCY